MTILTSFDCFNSLWRKNGNNYSVYRPRKWNTFKTESHARKYCVSVCAAFNILLQFFIESVCNMCLTHSKGCVSAGHEEKLRSLRFVSLSQLRNFIYTHAQTHTARLCSWIALKKKLGHAQRFVRLICHSALVTCQGGDSEGAELRKEKRGKEKWVSDTAAWRFSVCLCVCLATSGIQDGKTSHCALCSVTLCSNYKKKTKTKGEEKWLINGFSEIASEADHMCYILKNDLENTEGLWVSLLMSCSSNLWVGPSVDWSHSTKLFQMFFFFFFSPCLVWCSVVFIPKEAIQKKEKESNPSCIQ